MRKYVVEFIGTFFLVFVIGNVVIKPGADAMAPLAIGAILMVMIYAGGHISGAHYNPAVTTAAFVRGRCPASDLPGYFGSQFLAAIVAAFMVAYLKGFPQMPAPQALSVGPSLIAEFLGTFALAYVVLNTATSKATAGNSNYGLAIGATVMACAYALGGISGGAFNPAVALGITVMQLKPVTDIWVFLLANFAAGAAAGYTFLYLNPDDA